MRRVHRTTASDLLDRLGRPRVAAALGLTISAMNNAASRGKMPARWFAVIAALCAAEGIECPTEAFAMIRVKGNPD